MLGVLPDAVAADCSTAWPASAPAASTATVGGRIPRLLRRRARAGRRRRHDLRRPARARRRCARARRPPRPSAARRRRHCGPRPAAAASSSGSTAWSPPRTSCGGCSPSRSCLRPTPSGAARVVAPGPGVPQPAGAGRVSRLRGRRGAHRRARSTTPWATAEAGRRSCSRSKTTGPARWPRSPCPTCCWSTRCATGSTWWPRRARCSTRSTGSWCSRARPAPGRSWCGGGRARCQPLRRRRAPRRPCTPRSRGRPAARARPAAAAYAVRARTAADWWEDQLAAAARAQD